MNKSIFTYCCTNRNAYNILVTVNRFPDRLPQELTQTYINNRRLIMVSYRVRKKGAEV